MSKAYLVNGRFLAKPMGGVARVGRELLRALIAETRAAGAPALEIAAPPGALVPTPEGDVAALSAGDAPARLVRGWGSNLGEQVRLPLAYPGATILSFCNTTPILARRSVVWIHDTHVLDEPQTYTPAFRLWHRTLLEAVKLRRFPIVTVSAFSRERLITHGVAPERIVAVHNGGDHILRAPAEAGVLTRDLAGAPFVLVMGSPAKLKNLPFAIEALSARLPAAVRIAVVGLAQAGPYAQSGAPARDPRVVLLPLVSDGELRALYRAAAAVVVPSLLEGFGLYAAEAMFEGGPLVLSNRGALPEVGADAALFFDPTDPDALAGMVSQSLQADVRTRLIAAARERSAHFTWRRAAREVLAFIDALPSLAARSSR